MRTPQPGGAPVNVSSVPVATYDSTSVVLTKGSVSAGGGLFWPVGAGFALEATVMQYVHVVRATQGTNISVGVSQSK